jgi:hypothetical protein
LKNDTASPAYHDDFLDIEMDFSPPSKSAQQSSSLQPQDEDLDQFLDALG